MESGQKLALQGGHPLAAHRHVGLLVLERPIGLDPERPTVRTLEIRHRQGALIRRQADAVGRFDSDVDRFHLTRVQVVECDLFLGRLGEVQIALVGHHQVVRPHLLGQYLDGAGLQIDLDQFPCPRTASVELFPLGTELHSADAVDRLEERFHFPLGANAMEARLHVGNVEVPLVVRGGGIGEAEVGTDQLPALPGDQDLRERHVLGH